MQAVGKGAQLSPQDKEALTFAQMRERRYYEHTI